MAPASFSVSGKTAIITGAGSGTTPLQDPVGAIVTERLLAIYVYVVY